MSCVIYAAWVRRPNKITLEQRENKVNQHNPMCTMLRSPSPNLMPLPCPHIDTCSCKANYCYRKIINWNKKNKLLEESSWGWVHLLFVRAGLKKIPPPPPLPNQALLCKKARRLRVVQVINHMYDPILLSSQNDGPILRERSFPR